MFKRPLLAAALACALPATSLAAEADIATLRAEFDAKLKALQDHYEARLAELEARAAQATVAPAAAPVTDRIGEVSSGTAMNPKISVIFDGVYYTDNKQGAGPEMLEHIDGINHSHDHEGHSHGELERGFNLRETEIAFSSTVSPYFDAAMYMTVSSDGGVELEEAYFDTRQLPAGLKLRGGKFLSNIGYLNSQHPHTWDFVDPTLPYRTLLGDHGLMDTGVRLDWMPKTGSLYTLLGVELLQGREQTIATGSEELPDDVIGTGFGEMPEGKAGPRLMTAYAKFSPDLGDQHALRIGLWGARSNQLQEVHDHRDEDPAAVVHGLHGDASLWGLEAVYKFDAPAADGVGDLTLAAEYLRQRKDLEVAYHQANASHIGAPRVFTQDGFYLQAVYGFAPSWQVGLRYDVTGLTSEVDRGASVTRNEKSDRWTLAVTRNLTEFSRLRLQASTADLSVEGASERVNQVYLQYQHSLGSHGAHAF